MTTSQLGPFNLEKVFGAMNQITERMIRAATALEAAGVPYAVIGGNAVANWVSRVDDALVRFTKDVDLLMRLEDLDAAEAALAPVGFHRRKTLGITAFHDGTGQAANSPMRFTSFSQDRKFAPNTYCLHPMSMSENVATTILCLL
jgi:hypothetical protein